MTTQCRYCPLRRKDAFLPMSKDEVNFMEKFKSGELTVEPGTPILLEGSNSPQGEMGHSVEARTHMRLCVFNRSEFWNFFKNHPERAFDITWLAAIEEHFMGEVLATIGQRTAMQAIAWAMVKIFERGQSLGMVTHNQMLLPYSQRDLADALGLSVVHTNKTLGALKERQLLSWSDRVLQINDLAALAKAGMTELEGRQKRPLL